MSDQHPELLRVEALRKEFPRHASLAAKLTGATHEPLVAVRDVSLGVAPGETLAIVGESGSGKSTLGRMILGLMPPTSGTITFDGRDITALPPAGRRALTRDLQVIFQDPYSSLNPRQRIEDIIREPLDIHRIGTLDQRRERVRELMDQTALPDRYRRCYPHELSGGLRQRVGIATALAVHPKVIVADEPVSALDVSVQAQILDLLAEVQRQTSVAMVFISHDLGVVQQISDRVAVMCQGEIIELGPIEDVYTHPQHPYTRALLSAIPPADPTQPYQPIAIGDPVPLSDADPGCRFRGRCWLAEEVCAQQPPALSPRPSGDLARCHITERAPDTWFEADQAITIGGR
ncbi:ABC transporter ATP-binding protein [Rugosimonospora africana]|uniref:ABC transporter ATP-binding protein n=1 Tax=Rugosimonospora africana TaxID=556532 RepID=A0A8J3R1A1_9ACTN|nr:oligopeptide/dipeptide ABC transporter ATP-binding protein [Rugosimonospora africana]GIH21199.1 ABC transporter ATP-binding protein [Rugosimonospora africana]